MQLFYKIFFSTCLWLISLSPVLAQGPVFIGDVAEVVADYKVKANAKARNANSGALRIRHAISGQNNLILTINGSKKEGNADVYYGEAGDNNSTFVFKVTGNKLSGNIISMDQKKAYAYSSSNGRAYLQEVDINKVICVDYETRTTTSSLTDSQTASAMGAVPNLQSLPGATAVVLLDFDGQYVNHPYWNGGVPINAAPANMSEAEMVEIWKLMSEDFRPFALNLTTNESVYFNAPANRRTRVIFTSTNWFKDAGGVAYKGTFTEGNETPCWVFRFPYATISNHAEAGSHEVGHTLGLSHDGITSPYNEYYSGHSYWAPIMGTGYDRTVVQWSKGDYSLATNREDDLYAIATNNGFGYRPDDHSNSSSNATPVVKDAAGKVSASLNKGIITTRDDIDVFSFTSNGYAVSLSVDPSQVHPNLDILLTLKNASGQTILTANPPTLSASINQTLPAGTYYLYIDGTKGDFGADTDYSSLGEYSISGNITTNQLPVATLTAPVSGTTYTAPAGITLTATASDADGTVSRVEFYNGATKLGEDLTSPYSFIWSSVGAGSYQLTAKAIDNKGATRTSAAVSVRVNSTATACLASGTILREYWANVPGILTSVIPVGTTPASTAQLTSFEAPVDVADNYGQRIRGYLCAPVTGNYIFYIAGDDESELWISSSDNPAAKRKIAFLTGWTTPRGWTKSLTQKSALIPLQANTRYYIEALHKEGSGGDHLAVGWTTPGTSTIAVIPGSVLSPVTTTTLSNRAPVLAGIGSKTITLGQTLTFTARATDTDVPAQTINYSLTGSVPAGATINASTGTFNWTPSQAGSYPLTVKATDSGSPALSDEETISITVNHPSTSGIAFYRAINLNGDPISLDGNNWAGKTATNYTTNGGSFVNTTTGLVPATDATRSAMIRSSIWRYTALQLNLTAVPSGTYQVYLHVWEDSNPETYSLILEGKVVQSNYSSGSAGSWKKLGPYQASITDGTISIATTGGAVNFSGVEVWKVNTTARVAAMGGKHAEGWQVTLYPNPVVDKLQIQLPFSAEQVKATMVTDAAGNSHLVNGHKATGQDELEIKVETLRNGLYLLKIDTENGYRVTKFIKQ